MQTEGTRPSIHPGEVGDLTTCDREPIHIPGSIQPHGILLSLDGPDFTVLQASENAALLFGRDISAVIGAPLATLLGLTDHDELLVSLRRLPMEKDPLYVGSIEAPDPDGHGRTYNAVGHYHQGALILEMEATSQQQSISFQNLYPLVRTFMSRLQEINAVPELSQMAAEEVRRITGFNRVLVYRFDADWHGHVIAESSDDALPSYLDLWFPASDIPAQARELYRLNRLRLIADADYRPVPIVPTENPKSGRPLDLSYAALRSVSPVHIEYLHNSGIGASMSISVLLNGQLWGLIALHHKTARQVPFEVRVACDFLGQALSTQISRAENGAEYEHRLYLKSITTRLLGFMAEEDQFIEGLIHHPDELLSFAHAAGAAVLFEGKCFLLGRAPSEEDAWRLSDWLSSRGGDEVYHTDCLSLVMPDGERLREAASGVLAISISKLYRSYVIWFRPEVVQTVKWSGDPRKPVETEQDGSMRIHPRKSFEAWKETVRGRSLPWRASEVETASELRNAIVGVVLRKAEELAALSAELTRSNKELEAFSYSVSHDLRAPFRHIVGYSELLSEHLQSTLDETATRYIRTISNAAESAGNLVDSLLNFSRVGRSTLHLMSVDMRELVKDVLRDLALDGDWPAVKWDIPLLPVVQGDPILLRLVWQNLLSNALKFTRTREEPRIVLRASEDDYESIFSITDNGVGFKQAYVNKLFGVFQRLHSSEEFEGTGIGLANVRRAVGKHGGRTWAEGELDRGATFFFSIPKRVVPERGFHA